MPSAEHALLLRAMREKRPVACLYQGYPRQICPVMLGRTGLEEKALVFQFGGETSNGPLEKPDWKCFRCARSHSPNCSRGAGAPARSIRSRSTA